ncbi:AMP-dependent synthetase/ligase [Apiospora rasikravindrae]|uniref:AMP-dependent synthetase/ligase n=1 Tax=Apiospora rasikravindrae TaxID=990691 RepID=A0ABR1SN69_9PEZI
MAPVQQTFSVIPELPSAFANGSDTASARSSKPPMTTKQAKKLYKAATKAPKLSKAEQRKQDLMEQDRIRREFEKERNQARAKTARDKKKEKEEKEKADKKRKGLPLKEVHPSQDTLARFMRPLKPAKKVEEDSKPPPPSLPQTALDDSGDETLPGEDENRPVKRQRLEEPVEQALDVTTYDQSPSRSPEVKAQEKAAPEVSTMEAEKGSPVASPSICAAGNTKIEDQAGKCHANESFSADDGLDDDDFSALFVDVTLDPEPGLAKSPESRQSPLFPRPPDPLGPLEPAHRPDERVHPPADAREPIISRASIGSSSQHLRDVSPHETQKANRDTRDKHTPGLAKATSDLGNTNSTSQNTSRSHISSCQTLTTDSKTTNPDLLTNVLSNTKRPLSAGTSSRQAHVVRREPTHVPQTIKQPMGILPHAKPANPAIIQKMAPPPLPPRIHSSRSESVGLAGSRTKYPPSAAHTTPAVMPDKHTPIRNETTDEYTLPSSTQLFLLNNMDDLFPSPSQEVQEIFEKPRCIRNRTLSHQPLPPPRLTPSTTGAKVQNPPVTPQTSTARQPVRRMPPPSKTMPSVSPPKPKHNDVPRVPLQSHDKCNMSDGDFPFLSTQDIFMSSQDIRELEEDTLSPIKPLKPLGPSACNQPTRETLPPNHNSIKASIDGSKGQVTGSRIAPDSKTPKSCARSQAVCQTPLFTSSQYSNPQSRFIHPRVAPRSSANGVTPDEQRSSSSNPFRFKAPTHSTQRPSQGFQNAKTAPAVEPTGAAHSQSRETPRPSPKPFFTSSGTRELTFLAIERSKRSAREDLHARRRAEEDLAKQNKSKRLKETAQKEPKDFDVGKPPRSDDEIDDDNDYELDEILLASDLIKEPVSDNKTEPHATNTAKCEVGQARVQCPSKPVGVIPALIRPRSPDEKKSESVAQSKPKGSYEKMLELAARQRDAHDQGGKRIESMSEESDKENREQDIPMASQGTDYGDAAWDMTDLDLDSFL